MNGQMRNWLNGMISEFVKNSPENSLKMEPDEKAWACLHSRFTTVDLFKNLMDILGPDKGFRVLVVGLDEIVYCAKDNVVYALPFELLAKKSLSLQPSHCGYTRSKQVGIANKIKNKLDDHVLSAFFLVTEVKYQLSFFLPGSPEPSSKSALVCA